MIGCALWLAPHLDEPVKALAWGVFIGGVVQLLFQMPFLMKIGSLPKPRWGWKDEGVQKILRLMIPAMFGCISFTNQLIAGYITGFISNHWQHFMALLF